uniref:ARAD1D43472p n=1 Tax=Blastobotrys adeninivorans TaxID=409370 RepID=A0A060TDF7_BLAAD
MSSAVNKSSTRFAPKAPQRGAGRPRQRQLSMSSTSKPVFTDDKAKFAAEVSSTVSRAEPAASPSAPVSATSGLSSSTPTTSQSPTQTVSTATAPTQSTAPTTPSATEASQDGGRRASETLDNGGFATPAPPARLASLNRPTMRSPFARAVVKMPPRKGKAVNLTTEATFEESTPDKSQTQVDEPSQSTQSTQANDASPPSGQGKATVPETSSRGRRGEPTRGVRTRSSRGISPRAVSPGTTTDSLEGRGARVTRSSKSTERGSRGGRGESPSRAATFEPMYSHSIITDTMTPIPDDVSSARTRARTRARRNTRNSFTSVNEAQISSDNPASNDRQPAVLEEQRAPIKKPQKYRPPSPPPKVYSTDEKGRIILDPEDLPKFGRGHRHTIVDEPEMKVINVESFTMADLCSELPIGEKNEKYDTYEEFRRKRKKDREELLRLKKLARMEKRQLTEEELKPYRSRNEELVMKRKEDFNNYYRSGDDSARRNTQTIQLTYTSGRIGVAQESITVNRHAQGPEEAEREVIEEKEEEVMTNSATFSKREKPERWDEDETLAFYQAVSQWGTDFTLISQLFPGRSRRQIKAKFKLEEKRNPVQIQLAVMRKLNISSRDFSEQTGTEITAASIIEEDLKRVREEHELSMKNKQERSEITKQQDMEAALLADAQKYGGEVPVKKKEEHIDGEEPTEEIVGTVGS